VTTVDADFITASRTATPRLLDEVGRLTWENQNWQRKEVERGSCCTDMQARAEKAEAERDSAQLALREHAAAVELANHVYMDEIKRLMDEVVLHKAGHEGQTRNTMAFYDDCENLTKERDALKAELEVGRMCLVACGVVACADTPTSASEQRKMHTDYKSASCDSVASRVDECIALRSERDALKAEVERLRAVEKAANAWESANPGHIDEDTAFDYAAVARAILAGRGPEGKVKP